MEQIGVGLEVEMGNWNTITVKSYRPLNSLKFRSVFRMILFWENMDYATCLFPNSEKCVKNT